MTWALRYDDYSSAANFPESDGNAAYARYEEDVMVGYRYFDAEKIKTLYPFGYGLSYTTFAYSDMNVTTADNKSVAVALKVKNTGKVPGREVVQLYVSKPAVEGLLMPAKELVAFAKTQELQPGEEATIRLSVAPEYLTYYDETQNAWVMTPGQYNLIVAASAEDIRLQQAVEL